MFRGHMSTGMSTQAPAELCHELRRLFEIVKPVSVPRTEVATPWKGEPPPQMPNPQHANSRGLSWKLHIGRHHATCVARRPFSGAAAALPPSPPPLPQPLISRRVPPRRVKCRRVLKRAYALCNKQAYGIVYCRLR